MPDVDSTPSERRDLDKVTAGLLRRCFACLLDTLLLSPLLLLLIFPYVEAELGEGSSPGSFYGLAWWRLALILLLGILYGGFMLARYGRTVGMMKLGLRVTNLDGSDISAKKALLRTFAYWLPPILLTPLAYADELPYWLVNAGFTIGLLWIMVDKAHQGYHDKIAGTLVVHEQCFRERKSPTPTAEASTAEK